LKNDDENVCKNRVLVSAVDLEVQKGRRTWVFYTL